MAFILLLYMCSAATGLTTQNYFVDPLEQSTLLNIKIRIIPILLIFVRFIDIPVTNHSTFYITRAGPRITIFPENYEQS